MGRIRSRKDPDRYLAERGGVFYYKRRVPTLLAGVDSRGAHVRISLKTSDLAQARAARDLYEAADDELWAALHQGADRDSATSRYIAAVKRAEALGFSYRPLSEILLAGAEERVRRVEAIAGASVSLQATEALLGRLEPPAMTINKAFDVYLSEIVPHEISGKSAGQKKRWENGKRFSIANFVEVVGDLDINLLSRENALKFYRHWMQLIAPATGPGACSASHGNRRLGDMRVLYRDYFRHIGQHDRPNPFERLSFNERKATKKKRKRLPFSVNWITSRILAAGSMATLNDEARAIVFALIETGARLSEICNLTSERIVLNHPVPHLVIEPRDDPDDPREIKTSSSIRKVPLIGVSLAAMKKHPTGFPRYKDKESSLSATLNKYFTKNALRESAQHTMYSFRHAFEDRMKEAHVDSEVRRILMGHAIDRPEYGEGGSLKFRQGELNKIKLKFDPAIV